MREQTAEVPAEPASEIVRAPANAAGGATFSLGPIDDERSLRLQRTAGNRATRVLLARDPVTLAEVTVQGTAWKEDSVKAVQTELTRLRLYDKGIDGKPGFFTHQGLIEAFGGYE